MENNIDPDKAVSLIGLLLIDDKKTNKYHLFNLLLCSILCNYRHGKTHFITSLESGFGLLAGQAVLIAKSIHPEINLIVYPPFDEICINYHNPEDKKRYDEIIVQADLIQQGLTKKHQHGCVRDNYTRLINKSSSLIFFFTEDTYCDYSDYVANAYNYALRRCLSITDLYDYMNNIKQFEEYRVINNDELYQWLHRESRSLAQYRINNSANIINELIHDENNIGQIKKCHGSPSPTDRHLAYFYDYFFTLIQNEL